MKKALILSLLISTAALAFEGPDFMLTGDLYIPHENKFNAAGIHHREKGIEATFQNATLYGISSLKWNWVGAYIYSETGEIGMIFRSYGINNLYSSTLFSIFINKSIFERTILGFGYKQEEYNYGDNLYKASTNIFSVNAALKLECLNLSAVIDNLSPTERDYNNNPELLVAVYWQANEMLSVYSSYLSDDRNHNRFSIGQDLMLSKSLILKAGLLSSPEIYFVGLEIVYKRLIFGYTIYDIGGLPDCAKLTLSYR